MKKSLFFMCGLCLTIVGSCMFYTSYDVKNSARSLVLIANIDALSRTEGEDYSGQPCYNSGKYNDNYPVTLVCDEPCALKHWDPGFWSTTAVCY